MHVIIKMMSCSRLIPLKQDQTTGEMIRKMGMTHILGHTQKSHKTFDSPLFSTTNNNNKIRAAGHTHTNCWSCNPLLKSLTPCFKRTKRKICWRNSVGEKLTFVGRRLRDIFALSCPGLPCSGQHASGHGQGSVGDNRHVSWHPPDPWRVGVPGHRQGHPQSVGGQQCIRPDHILCKSRGCPLTSGPVALWSSSWSKALWDTKRSFRGGRHTISVQMMCYRIMNLKPV